MQENTNKNHHGKKGKESLESMIESIKSLDYIVYEKKNYSIADPEYSKKQFKFQYLIEFQDKEQWILHHTTTVRDRIHCQQWHSEHIKRLNKMVKKAYVVVPDRLSEKEEHTANLYNESIVQREIYSAIDGVLPFSKVYSLIEQKAAELLSSGKAHAKLGLNFEKRLVDLLNNRQNFDRWKNDSEISVGYLYSMYVEIVKKLQLDKKEVISLFATDKIDRLPSGGKPKTDVLLKVETKNGIEQYTFSCKRSNSDWVSVHDYTADAFSLVLNPADDELFKYLNEFQRLGGIKAFGFDNEIEFQLCMSKYSDKLAKWVIGGLGGEGDEKTQWANFIITVNEKNNTFSMNTIDEYIEKCKKSGIQGHFGTLFKWTYPSGEKGKRIQLKGKMF